MESSTMRKGMTMIELIFAIVVIAISIVSIPSMMSVASQATKGITVDDDVLKRMAGEMVKVFQTRWDGNYGPSDSGVLLITSTNDLNCSPRPGSAMYYRLNPDSMVQCNENNATPSAIPNAGAFVDLRLGIEQINNFTYNLDINAGGGELYHVPITYAVGYVDSTVNVNGNTATAIWRLGSSSDMNPNPSGTTHLKRVVARCVGNAPDVDISLTFFKSNKGN